MQVKKSTFQNYVLFKIPTFSQNSVLFKKFRVFSKIPGFSKARTFKIPTFSKIRNNENPDFLKIRVLTL